MSKATKLAEVLERYSITPYEQQQAAALLRTQHAALVQAREALEHLLHNLSASGKRIDLGLAPATAQAAIATLKELTQ